MIVRLSSSDHCVLCKEKVSCRIFSSITSSNGQRVRMQLCPGCLWYIRFAADQVAFDRQWLSWDRELCKVPIAT